MTREPGTNDTVGAGAGTGPGGEVPGTGTGGAMGVEADYVDRGGADAGEPTEGLGFTSDVRGNEPTTVGADDLDELDVVDAARHGESLDDPEHFVPPSEKEDVEHREAGREAAADRERNTADESNDETSGLRSGDVASVGDTSVEP